jgi:predicted kinase
MTKKVILTRGLPASGKSTWAKKLIDDNPGMYKRISKDSLREMLDNGKWNKANEKFVLKARDALILEALDAGYHVIVDDTNLSVRHERTIRELVKGKATVEIQDFADVPLEVCLERDRHRPNYVGEKVIRRMYRDFLQPKPQTISYDSSLPDAIIVDLDGTLALLNGRNPYDASKCEEDSVNEVVLNIMESSSASVLLVSGRSDEHRPQTERWLLKHGINYTALHMRKAGDNRKDAIIKREIYDEHIVGRCNIKYVLDDRTSVVNLWRSLGLVCLQVADGDF